MYLIFVKRLREEHLKDYEHDSSQSAFIKDSSLLSYLSMST